MTDIIKAGAHRAEVEQAREIRAELCRSRGLEQTCCGMPASGGHVQRMDELQADRYKLRNDLERAQKQCNRLSDAMLKLRDELGDSRRELGEMLLQRNELRAKVEKWRTTLTAVMPPDFKDWHQNTPAEWPDIAAWAITNAREQCDAAEGLADIAISERDALRAAARAVVERWDSPLWKDLPHTGVFIAALRRAIDDSAS